MLQRQRTEKVKVSAPDAELEVEEILIDEETDEINMEEIQNDVDSDIELMDDEWLFVKLGEIFVINKGFLILKYWNLDVKNL